MISYLDFLLLAIWIIIIDNDSYESSYEVRTFVSEKAKIFQVNIFVIHICCLPN